MDGFSFCRWIRNQPEGDRHVVLIGTASDRTEDLQKILEAGADDYIIKPYQADVLDVRLAIAQQRIKDIEMRKCSKRICGSEQERLSYLATHDPLTKLANRAFIHGNLAKFGPSGTRRRPAVPYCISTWTISS